MLNTHAAVLEAAFPERHLGMFRSTISKNSVKFKTWTAFQYDQSILPGISGSTGFSIPENTVQASLSVAWSLSTNDFGLKLYDTSSQLRGQSNNLNVAGLTGLREKVVMRNPASGDYRSSVTHTGSVGTQQQIAGALEITQIEYPTLLDVGGLSSQSLWDAQASLATNIMLPEGRKFRPEFAVTRGDFVEAILRSGLVPQYSAGSPMFSDVRDAYTRNSVESAQANPAGKLIYDAEAGGRFYQNNSLNKLVAAVALVRAANLESSAASAFLPHTVADAASIPVQFRGYVAVALQRGFLSLDGSKFNATRPITRIELAKALVMIALRD